MNNDFWNFSVQRYSRSGVADSCLALQDEHGLDVNVVLFCLWYGQNFGELSQSQLEEAISFSTLWASNVVKPLRQTRRWIKQHNQETGIPADDLEKYRGKVKQLELAAERLQQNQLQQLAQVDSNNRQDHSSMAINKNLDRYLQAMEVEKSESATRYLGIITGQL